MDEKEHMPRYTMTLVDSTGAMEPLALMDDDLKSIAVKLEGRVLAKTRGRRPRGTGGISATPKGYRAYSTVTDPLTGKDHRVSGFGRTRSQVCFCKLASTVWALFFSSIGGWFPAETASSEPAAPFFLGYLVMRACSLR